MSKPASKRQSALTPLQISLFFSELSLLFGSGISLSESLYIMADSATDKSRKQLCSQMASSIDYGGTLPESADASGVFPDHVVQMLSIAQTSGKMEETIAGLAAYYDRMDSLRKAVKNTMTFPLVMMAVMFCVLAVLIIKVLPLFGAVFIETGAKMPLIISLVTESKAFEFILLAVLVLLVGLVAAAFVSGGRIMISADDSGSLMARLPVIRSIRQKTQSGSFAYSMALLLAGGVTVEQALQLSADTGESEWIRAKAAQVLAAVREGETFTSAVSECHVFDGYYPALLAAGEKSGEIDKVMNMISDRYTEEINDRISSVLGLVEPVLVIVMTLIVGSILLSIMIPLMNVMASV